MCARRDPGPIWVPTLAPAGPKNPASRSQEFAGDQKKQNACSWNIGNCSFRCLKIQIFACGACHMLDPQERAWVLLRQTHSHALHAVAGPLWGVSFAEMPPIVD